MLKCDLTDPNVYDLYRVGLMGNPSDGFNGKTIAMSISNFWAEVTLVESQTLVTHVHVYAHTCIQELHLGYIV